MRASAVSQIQWYMSDKLPLLPLFSIWIIRCYRRNMCQHDSCRHRLKDALSCAAGAPLSDEALAEQAAALIAGALQPTAQSIAWAL